MRFDNRSAVITTVRIRGEIEDVATEVCSLSSDEAGYRPGTNLDIDGGYVMDDSMPKVSYL